MRDVYGFTIGEPFYPGPISEEDMEEARRLYGPTACPHEWEEPHRFISFDKDGATVSHMKKCAACGLSVAHPMPGDALWDWIYGSDHA